MTVTVTVTETVTVTVTVAVIGPVIVAVHVNGNATVIVIAPVDDQGSIPGLVRGAFLRHAPHPDCDLDDREGPSYPPASCGFRRVFRHRASLGPADLKDLCDPSGRAASRGHGRLSLSREVGGVPALNGSASIRFAARVWQ